MPSIGIGISRVIKGSWLNSLDALAPSALTLTVLSDTSIKLDWTVNSTNMDGHSIERSTDGVTYAEIGTVAGTTATYTDTTGADGTRYYYRVKAYAGAVYSDPCTAANDWCAIKMVLTSTGTGAGVSTVRFWFNVTNTVVTLDGNGKWYSDSGGTADESTSYTFVAGELRTRYLKVTSGVSNMLIFRKGDELRWGSESGDGFISGKNAASVAKDISTITNITYLYCGGNNTLSGNLDLLSDIIILYVRGSNTLSGNITKHSNMTFCRAEGLNTLTGDIGGAGTAAFVYGVTTLYLSPCRFVDYTSGATWSLTATSIINPAVGYGYSSTEIDNILIDMAASIGTVVSKTITLQGSSAARTSASDAAVSTLNGKGWTIVTN